jgi:hypothetical protein
MREAHRNRGRAYRFSAHVSLRPQGLARVMSVHSGSTKPRFVKTFEARLVKRRRLLSCNGDR